MITFPAQRGEPITFTDRVRSGDPAGYTVRALLKPAPDFSVPADAVASVAEFQSEFRAATGDDPAMWLFWINAVDADDLPRGRYATDVRYSLDGVPVAVTDPAFIILTESVSG